MTKPCFFSSFICLYGIFYVINYNRFNIIRLSLALFSGISSVVIYSYSEFNQNLKLIGFGVIFIAIGINILLFKPIMKNEGTI